MNLLILMKSLKGLKELISAEQPFDSAEEIISLYLVEFTMLKDGKKPDGVGVFDG